MTVFVHVYRPTEESSQELVGKHRGRGSWDFCRGSGSIASGLYCYAFADKDAAFRALSALESKNRGIHALLVTPNGPMLKVPDVMEYVALEDLGKEAMKLASPMLDQRWSLPFGASVPKVPDIARQYREKGIDVTARDVRTAVAACASMYHSGQAAASVSALLMHHKGFAGLEALGGCNCQRMGSVIWSGGVTPFFSGRLRPRVRKDDFAKSRVPVLSSVV